MPTVRTVPIATLKPHRLQTAVFPGRKADEALIASVRNLGVIENPSVSEDLTILSGARRVDAAEQCGLETIEVRIWDMPGESPEADEIWIDSNVNRSDLTNEEKARLYMEQKRVQLEISAKRTHATKPKPQEETTAGNLPAASEPQPDTAKGSKKSARDKAAETVGLSGKTAEKLAVAVVAKDAAKAAGDTVAVEKITAAIETSAAAAVTTAVETGYLPGEEQDRLLPSPEKSVSKLREKALKAVTDYSRALEPAEQDIKLRSMLSECGISTSETMMENLKPLTSEEFIVWMKDAMEELTRKEHTKASELAIFELIQNVDAGKIIPQLMKGRKLKTTAYLPELPDTHAEATELVEQELKHRFKQLKGFECWDQNGRPKACRTLVKATRAAVKGFENHCAVGDEEQPALVDVKFPEKLDTPEFRKVWAEYWDHRKKTKKPITETVRERSFNRLISFAEGTVEDAIAIVGKTIESNWKGIPDDVWNTIWSGPDIGKKRPNSPTATAAAPGEDLGQLFDDVVLTIQQTYHPDLKNRDDVLKALKTVGQKKDAPAIEDAVTRIGVSNLFLSKTGSIEQRAVRKRFIETIMMIRDERKVSNA